MNPGTGQRTERREVGRSAKALGVVGAVATTAAALTAAIAPPAAPVARNLEVALAAEWGPIPCGAEGKDTCYGYPAYSVGPLIGLALPILDIAGFNPFALSTSGVAYNFTPNSGGKRLYDAINGLAYGPVQDIPNLTCAFASQDSCRTAFAFTTGIGAFGVADAINALWSSAEGDTRRGYAPLALVGSTPGGPPSVPKTGITQTSAVYLNNVLRPNGGLATRFAPLLNILGVNTAMPSVGEIPTPPEWPDEPAEDAVSLYNWSTDLTWAYNTLADFPITLNPFSIINSAFATLPPPDVIAAAQTPGGALFVLSALLGGARGTLYGKDLTPLISLPSDNQCPTSKCDGNFLSSGLQAAIDPALSGRLPYGLSSYGVLGAAPKNGDTALPILYPTYLASALVNPVLKALKSPYLLGTPLADILSPAMKILVNIGYDDVLTPEKLTTPDTNNINGFTYADEGYTAYDRTFYQLTPDKPTPFAWFRNPAMTAEQTSAAYVDAWKAFTGALKAQFEKPLWGILVPNPDNPPGGAGSVAAKSSATTQTVAAKLAATAPVAAPPVSAPEPVLAPEAVLSVPAPVSVPEPPAPALLSALADDLPSAAAAPVRRGARAAAVGDNATAGHAADDNGGPSSGPSGQRTRR